jgi:hypothetical protein
MNTPSTNPADLPSWVTDGPCSNDRGQTRTAFIKLAKYKGWSFKDIKVDVVLVRHVAAFLGLESAKWRSINPLAIRFQHKAAT